MRKIAGKIFGFVILAWAVMGLFAVLVSPFEMYQKLQAESWPSRKGEISISYANFNRGKKESYWDTQICGYYTGSGEKFCITRVRYGGFRFGEGKALAFDAVARYPVGRVVDVYYSPDNPKTTILEAHSSWQEMFTLFGLGLLGVLLPVFLWVFRKQIEPGRYS